MYNIYIDLQKDALGIRSSGTLIETRELHSDWRAMTIFSYVVDWLNDCEITNLKDGADYVSGRLCFYHI
jgi:hypothetical protein